MKKKLVSIAGGCLLLLSNSFGKNNFDNNIEVEADMWNAKLSGTITNSISNVSLDSDLGYKDGENITNFRFKVGSAYAWLPDISFEYFNYDVAQNTILNSAKKIDNAYFNGSVSTITTYNEYNGKIYGYIKNDVAKFDVGIDIKNIDYTQTIKENSKTNGLDKANIAYSSTLYLPYVGLSLNYKNITYFAINSSITSIGDDKARDYSMHIGYKPFDNIELLAGYKYHNFEISSSNDRTEKYKTTLKGNFFGAKLIF